MSTEDPVIQERIRNLISQGQAAAQAGQRELARRYLQAAIDLDPNNVDAWLWLAGVQDDPMETKQCLERVLELDPGNVQAQRGLQWVEAQLAERQQQAPAPEPETPSRARAIHQELRAHLRTPVTEVEEEEAPAALAGETTSAGSSRFQFLSGEDILYRSLTLALTGLLVLGIVLLVLLVVGVIRPLA